MKLFLSILFFFLMFLNQEVYAQVCDFIPTGTPANPKTNDNPYIPAGPLSSYERYLARSVQMNLLPTLLLNNNTNSNTQFNGSICTDPCLQDCRNAFCCQKYNQDINMLADINAAYIVAAGYYEPNLSLWAASDIDHNPLYTGINPSLEVIKRIPKDINEAYDYRGLRRPIIDNFIAENINGTISEVKIPKSVIKLFIDEMSYSEKTTYLINPAIIDNPNAPNDFSNIRDIYFNFNKSSWSYTYEQTTVNSMDVNKIEGRMWLFFISKQYIDMGYTSINLSQANFFFSKDEAKTYGNIPTELNNLSQSEKEANAYPPNGKQIYSNDVKKGYYNLGRACSKIRDYAASKGKFILLWTQADRIYYAYKEIATTRKGITTYTYQKENKYIFDFNSSAMRVREVDDSHLNEGRNLAIGSTVPSKPAMTEAAFNAGMPRCTSCLKAAVDPGSGINYERNAPGYSPRPWKNERPNEFLNGIYYDKEPTLVYYDSGNGRVLENEPRNLLGRCTAWSGSGLDNGGAWGNDDNRWFFEFAAENGDNCIIDWLKYQYSNIRTFNNSDHVYFQVLPGRILKGLVSGFDSTSANFKSFTTPGPTFRLAEHPTIINAIKTDIWKVNDVNESNNGIAYSYYPDSGPAINSCTVWDNQNICYGTTTSGTYIFNVKNPDRSSIYTWHIEWSDGSWEPYTYGITRVFIPNRVNQTFTITLVQDNLGLPSSKFGVSTATLNNLPVTESNCRYDPFIDCSNNPFLKQINANTTLKSEKKHIIGEIEIGDNEVTLESGNLPHKTNKTKFNINYYPQPVSSILNLTYELPSSGKLIIEVLNVLGETVGNKVVSEKEKGVYIENLNFSDFAKGVYFIKFTFNNQLQSLKVIKY